MALLGVLAASSAAAAPVFAGWVGVEGTLEIGRDAEVSVEEELRTELVPLGPSELLTSLSGRYDVTKGLALGAGYRLQVNVPGADIGHRLAFDLRLDHRIDDFVVRFRQRYTVELGSDTVHTLRSRLALELRADALRPFVAVEPFVRVDPTVRLHKVRFTVGTSVRLDDHAIRLFSHFEQQTDGDQLLVVGLGASLATKLRRRGDG